MRGSDRASGAYHAAPAMPSGRGALALLALSILPACGQGASGASGALGDVGAAGATTTATASAAAQGAPGGVPTSGCADRIARLLREPALAGAPAFEAGRVELVGRPRGTPLLWKRVPAARQGSASAASALAKLEGAERPLPVLKGLVRRYGRSPETLRGVVLREGYVYADRAEVALALVETVRITHLFKEPVVYLLRGQSVHMLRRAERTRYLPERYVHDDGPMKGAVAELLLGDRFAAERAEVERAPAAVDLVAAAEEAGSDRLRVKHLAEVGLVADLRYGGAWVTAAFEMEGPRLRVACVDGPAEALTARERSLEATADLRRALAKIRATVHAEVQEEPRFDEPKDEPDGEQQDGALRREWRRAYEKGLRRYSVGSRDYDVYDADGRAVPPQVCVDFITDTWERASGTWYDPLPPAFGNERPKPAPRRVIGGVDFDKFDLENRRSVAELVAFARRHAEMFEVLDVPQEERIPFTRRSELFAYLARRSNDFAPGDVLVIHGLKDDGRPHYHSVMIVEQDPITGVPTLVAGNAGRPREQTLEGVMARSPKRSIKQRIRPRPEWLAKVVLGHDAAPAKP